MLGPVLIVIAALVGIVSAMTGLGGGFLIVPFLVLLFHLEIHQAVGTSLVMIIFTAASATFAYARQKRIDYKVSMILSVGTVPGAVVGAYLTTLISGKLLSALFGVFLLIIALQMVRRDYKIARSETGLRRTLVDSKGVSFDYTARVAPGLLLSFLGGVASGLFGVGGGVVMVPVMVMVVGMPFHLAVAASMFIMLFTSISGAATHLSFGNIVPVYAFYLSIGIVLGTQIGAAVARRLRHRVVQTLFATFLSIVGIRMILGLF